jgi:hypothetical protein
MATKTKTQKPEVDSVYFLKVLVYFSLGALWVGINDHRVLPLGLIAGVLLAQHEKLQLDRKIEYALLVIAALLGLFGLGITLAFHI